MAGIFSIGESLGLLHLMLTFLSFSIMQMVNTSYLSIEKSLGEQIWNRDR